MSAYLNSLLLSKDLNAEGGRRGKGMGAQTCWYHLAYSAASAAAAAASTAASTATSAASTATAESVAA
jgi:hypothetical protein